MEECSGHALVTTELQNNIMRDFVKRFGKVEGCQLLEIAKL
jgi:hypothetical protein